MGSSQCSSLARFFATRWTFLPAALVFAFLLAHSDSGGKFIENRLFSCCRHGFRAAGHQLAWLAEEEFPLLCFRRCSPNRTAGTLISCVLPLVGLKWYFTDAWSHSGEIPPEICISSRSTSWVVCVNWCNQFLSPISNLIVEERPKITQKANVFRSMLSGMTIVACTWLMYKSSPDIFLELWGLFTS